MQSRSRAIVDAVIESTTHILGRVRIEDTSTNKIAELAGVSVGSLYQYFPNKHSLVSTLIEKELEKNRLDVKRIFDDNAHAEVHVVIEMVVDYVCRRLLSQRTLTRHLLMELSNVKQMGKILDVRRDVANLFKDFLLERSPWLSERALELKCFVLINAVMGSLNHYILDQEQDFQEHEIKSELIELTHAYLASFY